MSHTTPVDLLLSKLENVKPTGSGYSACCPAHDDRQASLSVTEGDDGRALVKCHAGCKIEDVCRAVCLRVADLMPSNGKPRIVSEYDYRDEAGNVLSKRCAMSRRTSSSGGQRRAAAGTWSVKGRARGALSLAGIVG